MISCWRARVTCFHPRVAFILLSPVSVEAVPPPYSWARTASTLRAGGSKEGAGPEDAGPSEAMLEIEEEEEEEVEESNEEVDPNLAIIRSTVAGA